MVRRWSPPQIGPPLGPYSHLAVAPTGSQIVFVAGQVGAGPDGELIAPDAESQTRQVFLNIMSALAAAGGGPPHLVRLFTMVAGPEHLAGYRAGLGRWLDTWFPDGDFPAQSLIVVAGLARPEIVVEVEACAAVPDRSWVPRPGPAR
jgi:2-iminobutanoate/2-iminopropanoate deaminase